MNILPLILAQADPPAPSMLEQIMGGPFLMIGVLFLMMYFLMIRPQKKQRDELAARIASMEKGDEVITSGGLHAIVHHLSEKTVTLKLSEGVFVPFEKSAVQSVIKKRSGSSKSGGDKSGNDKDASDDK